MRLPRLDAPRAHELEELHSLCEFSFPPEERRDWDSVINGGEKGPALYAIYDDDSQHAVGMVTLWTLDSFVYIEHFAVYDQMRGHGIGGRTLTAIKEKYPGKNIVLEVEKPEVSPEAKRRIAFYERNGFRTISDTYIQPPYRPGLPSVPLNIMATHPVDNAAAIEKLLQREVYGLTDARCVTG
ncbi:MAG: GNAT family N-acetyltransferase [Bacteroidales bacterium]|nr:GNAT family N-acetyltransferase [Bacteroidales bacterium]